jgi:indole-3-acetate monooxygenase
MAQAAKSERAGVAAEASSLVAKAQELNSFFIAQAERNEAQGSLTDEVFKTLSDNGFFGLWVPKCFGGSEASPIEGLEVIEALSYADGSTGWVVMAAQVATATAAAYLPSSAAEQIFGSPPAIIAGQGAPLGRADVVGKGFRLTGQWHYGSGLLHANYIHTGGIVYENDAPRMLPGTKLPEARIFIVPRKQARLLGNWDVLGLRATGSVDYALDGVYVPEEFTHLQSAAKPRQGGNLYKLGISGLGSICHTAFALGTGRRMLDELATLARAESGRPALLPQIGGGESFQEQFGLAEAKLRSSRAFAREVLEDIQSTLQRGGDITRRQFTLEKLALNYATSAIAEACTFAYRYAGGVAFRNGTMQRLFRDMNSGTAHITTGPNFLRECGKDLLGLAEGKVWGSRGFVDPPVQS